MPEDGRFSEREIEQRLKDLGARIEYPPAPDVARTVQRKLDEEQSREARRRWPSLLAPRWTAVAVALVLISVFALSPTLRTALSDLFVTQSGSEAGSAAKPEGGGSEDRYKQEEEVIPQEAGAPAAGEPEAATDCPSPSIKAVPARAAAGAKFRLRGRNISGCKNVTTSQNVTILFQQDGKTRKLATLDAGRAMTFDAELRVPGSAGPGPARIRATVRTGEPVEARFLVLP